MFRKYLFFGGFLLLVAGIFRLGAGAGAGGNDSWLRAAVAPLAGFFLRTFNDSGTAIALCFVMILSALLALFYNLLWRIDPALTQLRQIAARVASLPAGIRGETMLAELDTVFSRFPILERPWRLFSRQLSVSVDGHIEGEADAGSVFSTQSLEAGGLRLRFFLGLPGDFVGIGLIFTFMGLVAGLYFASQSIMTGDLEASRAALNQLLHASTFKFLTSITGIGISVALSWAQRILVDRLDQRLEDIHFLVAERLSDGRRALSPMPAPKP